MANSQPPHEPTGPTQQQDDIFRVFAIVLGGTIATLASFWTFAQVILFIDPFSLLWVPGVAYCLLFIIAGVLTLYLWGQFFCQTTDGNRFMWLPWFIHRHPGAVLLSCAVLMFLMSSVALKVTSAASELPGFTFAVLGVTFAVLGVVTAVVLVLYLYDRFFCRTTHGNRHTPFPSFMLRHPGAVLLSFAVLMFLMSSVALKTTSEEEIAQKLLADRGMQLSPEELKNQLSLLNHSALSLFGRAGIVTDNIFEVLGQQSPYVSDREPVVLDMIDKIESMGDHAQRHEAVEKLLRWIKGLGNDGNSHLDHTIP